MKWKFSIFFDFVSFFFPIFPSIFKSDENAVSRGIWWSGASRSKVHGLLLKTFLENTGYLISWYGLGISPPSRFGFDNKVLQGLTWFLYAFTILHASRRRNRKAEKSLLHFKKVLFLEKCSLSLQLVLFLLSVCLPLSLSIYLVLSLSPRCRHRPRSSTSLLVFFFLSFFPCHSLSLSLCVLFFFSTYVILSRHAGALEAGRTEIN